MLMPKGSMGLSVVLDNDGRHEAWVTVDLGANGPQDIEGDGDSFWLSLGSLRGLLARSLSIYERSPLTIYLTCYPLKSKVEGRVTSARRLWSESCLHEDDFLVERSVLMESW